MNDKISQIIELACEVLHEDMKSGKGGDIAGTFELMAAPMRMTVGIPQELRRAILTRAGAVALKSNLENLKDGSYDL